MAPKRAIANLYSSKYYHGKKNKLSLGGHFLKVFYKIPPSQDDHF